MTVDMWRMFAVGLCVGALLIILPMLLTGWIVKKLRQLADKLDREREEMLQQHKPAPLFVRDEALIRMEDLTEEERKEYEKMLRSLAWRPHPLSETCTCVYCKMDRLDRSMKMEPKGFMAACPHGFLNWDECPDCCH